jgi:hypothetical protein
LRAWYDRASQHAKEQWWVWLLGATLEDRIMGWINATLDSLPPQSEWATTIRWALLTFDSIGLGFIGNLFVLTILILVIHAYFETRSQPFRASQPQELPSVGDDTQEYVERKHHPPHVRFPELLNQAPNDDESVSWWHLSLTATRSLRDARVWLVFADGTQRQLVWPTHDGLKAEYSLDPTKGTLSIPLVIRAEREGMGLFGLALPQRVARLTDVHATVHRKDCLDLSPGVYRVAVVVRSVDLTEEVRSPPYTMHVPSPRASNGHFYLSQAPEMAA